jgi:aspartate aminotransferase-like enzyme
MRSALRRHALPPLASEEDAAPGVVTVPLREVSAGAVARELAERGFEVAWQSRYLQRRNWLQIALMGEIDDDALRRLPAELAARVDANQRSAVRWRIARRDHSRSTAARR